MSKNFRIYLTDIHHISGELLEYASELSFELLESDKRTYQAILYNLLILGEAAKRVPETIREQYPYVDWRGMTGLRDILIHNYDKTQPRIVWDVLSVEIPRLHQQVKEILKRDNTDDSA